MDVKRISEFYRRNRIPFGATIPTEMLEGIPNLDLLNYLKFLLPESPPFVSSVYLISADGVQAFEEPHIYEHALFKNGFFPVAQSMAADLLSVDKISGQVFWFKLDHFVSDLGTIIDLNNVEQEATPKNLKEIGIYVGEFNETFIERILDGAFTRLFNLLGE